MTLATQEYIDDIAYHVLDAYNITVPIHNIDDVVWQLGGTVSCEHLIGAAYDGAVCKTGDESFCIAASPFLNEPRRTFTIAHELGHLFLHMGFRSDLQKWRKQSTEPYRSHGAPWKELEANEFAEALLMPKKTFKCFLDEAAVNHMVDIVQSAQRFNVSYSAVLVRGRTLGLLHDG